MEYRVLGPLEAVDNGRRLNLGGARQQAVLASLLVHADQTVPLERLEDRLEADLACGKHRDLVGELQALVAEQPLRQRLRAHLMLALYRSGRASEALEVYRQTRRLLVDELGLEPGEELRALERAILRADPALELPTIAPSNLPAQATPLVGRERELAEVLKLLRE